MFRRYNDRRTPGRGESRGRLCLWALGAAVALLSAAAPCSPAAAAVSYHGGPVMGSPGHVGEYTTKTIYWAPAGYSYPAGYQNAIETFLNDVAADSGKPTNPYAVATQYTQTAGTAHGESYTAGHISYSAHHSGFLTDTNPYPSPSLCTDMGHLSNTCLEPSDVEQEVTNFTASRGLPTDLAHLYIVILPPNVSSCDVDANCHCVWGSGAGGSGGVGNRVVVTLPYPNDDCYGPTAGPDSVLTTPAMGAVKLIGHESMQSIVNPLNTGWRTGDTSGAGISDLCQNTYGTVSGSGDSAYNTVINGHHYLLQWEWSNQDNACSGWEEPPTASFAAPAGTVPSGALVVLDGSGSSDPDGTVASYAWDFGDGATAVVAAPTHRYARSGTYPITLTVTDDEGWTATATRSITVTNRPPSASFTVSPSPVAGEPVTLTSTASDPDGTLTLAWDLGGLGTFADGGGATLTHVFANPGTFSIALRATDDEGASATATAPITISPNRPPAAELGVPGAPVCAGSPATLDGSGSADPEGHALAFAWDLDGDGAFETATGSSAAAGTTYTTAGSHPVALRVTDVYGNAATASATVVVAACQAAGGDGSGPTGSAPDGGGGTDGGSAGAGGSGGAEDEIDLILHMPRGLTVGGFVRRGLPLRMTCAAACAVRARLLLDARHAQGLGIASGAVTLASGRVWLAAGRTTTIRIRPDRRLMRSLRRARTLSLTLALVVADRGGRSRTINRRVVLGRSGIRPTASRRAATIRR